MADDLKVTLIDKPCPKCGKGILRRVSLSGQPVSYYCITRRPGTRNCELKFEVFVVIPQPEGGWIVKGKAVNPDYVKRLNSGDFGENLAISEQLERQGVAFFLDKDDIALETLNAAEAAAVTKRKR